MKSSIPAAVKRDVYKRQNWDWFSSIIKKANRPVKILNLFAYTGGATCAAAKALSLIHIFSSVSLFSDHCLNSGNIFANFFDSACIL